jgi:CRISPR-associated exonuclease Cas4
MASLPITPAAGWIAASAFVLGLMLVLAGKALRRRHGLGAGRTIALDNVTLVSRRLGLAGRVDRLVRTGGSLVPEEWKSARVLRPWHRAQMGVYLLLIEDQMRVRPAYGVIVCGDGTRHRVENIEELRAWVLDLAARIRKARAEMARPMAVSPRPGQCPPCGMRRHYSQVRV